MTILISDGEARDLLDVPSLVDELEAAFFEAASGGVIEPPRLNMSVPTGMLRIMPVAMNAAGVMGFKAFHRTGPTGARYLIVLYEQQRGELLALIDANWLTAARTGAVTGVATKYLARADACTAGVIGSGKEAETNLLAVNAVRPLREVRVFSPNADHRRTFAAKMTDLLGITVIEVDDPRRCVESSDIAVVATNTGRNTDRVAFEGSWMQPGMHVNSIGSTVPALREIDVATFHRSDRVVVDSPLQIRVESGDVIAAEKDGWATDVMTELSSLVGGSVGGRTNEREITLFKSVGSALQDIATAWWLYREAVRLGKGRDLGDILVPNAD